MNIFTSELAEKRLGLLHDLIPTDPSIAMLVNPHFPPAAASVREAEAAARAIGKRISVFSAGTENEIDAAFAAVARAQVQALIVAADPFFNSRRDRIVAMASRLKTRSQS